MFITLLTFEYILRPALLDPMPQQIGNYTQFVRALPMSIWVPFDEQEYYYVLYIIKFFSSFFKIKYSYRLHTFGNVHTL